MQGPRVHSDPSVRGCRWELEPPGWSGGAFPSEPQTWLAAKSRVGASRRGEPTMPGFGIEAVGHGEQCCAFFKGFLWMFFKSFRVTQREGHLRTEVEFQAGVLSSKAGGRGRGAEDLGFASWARMSVVHLSVNHAPTGPRYNLSLPTQPS